MSDDATSIKAEPAENDHTGTGSDTEEAEMSDTEAGFIPDMSEEDQDEDMDASIDVVIKLEPQGEDDSETDEEYMERLQDGESCPPSSSAKQTEGDLQTEEGEQLDGVIVKIEPEEVEEIPDETEVLDTDDTSETEHSADPPGQQQQDIPGPEQVRNSSPRNTPDYTKQQRPSHGSPRHTPEFIAHQRLLSQSQGSPAMARKSRDPELGKQVTRIQPAQAQQSTEVAPIAPPPGLPYAPGQPDGIHQLPPNVFTRAHDESEPTSGTMSEVGPSENDKGEVSNLPEPSPTRDANGMFTGTEIFKCDQCEQMYSSQRYLNEHKKSHPQQSKANSKTSSQQSCKRCRGVISATEPHKCSEAKKFKCSCGQIFQTKSHFTHHTNRKTCPCKCPSCGLQFSANIFLERHIADRHRGQQAFKCQFCEKMYSSANNRKHHEYNQHLSDGRYACQYCGKTFAWQGHGRTHENQVHTGDKPYWCSFCSDRFATKDDKTAHESVSHAGEYPFKCQYCSSGFNDWDAHKLHEQEHMKNQDFRCTKCDKVLKTAKGFKKHMKKHLDTKDLKCEICGYECFGKSLMKVHMNAHQPVKTHKCSYCDQFFSTGSNLRQHQRIHRGDKPYACSFCGKAFNNSTSRKTHERIHTGEKPYGCKFCEQRYASHSSCRHHELRLHGELLARGENQNASNSGGLQMDILSANSENLHPASALLASYQREGERNGEAGLHRQSQVHGQLGVGQSSHSIGYHMQPPGYPTNDHHGSDTQPSHVSGYHPQPPASQVPQDRYPTGDNHGEGRNTHPSHVSVYHPQSSGSQVPQSPAPYPPNGHHGQGSDTQPSHVSGYHPQSSGSQVPQSPTTYPPNGHHGQGSDTQQSHASGYHAHPSGSHPPQSPYPLDQPSHFSQYQSQPPSYHATQNCYQSTGQSQSHDGAKRTDEAPPIDTENSCHVQSAPDVEPSMKAQNSSDGGISQSEQSVPSYPVGHGASSGKASLQGQEHSIQERQPHQHPPPNWYNSMGQNHIATRQPGYHGQGLGSGTFPHPQGHFGMLRSLLDDPSFVEMEYQALQNQIRHTSGGRSNQTAMQVPEGMNVRVGGATMPMTGSTQGSTPSMDTVSTPVVIKQELPEVCAEATSEEPGQQSGQTAHVASSPSSQPHIVGHSWEGWRPFNHQLGNPTAANGITNGIPSPAIEPPPYYPQMSGPGAHQSYVPHDSSTHNSTVPQ